MSLGAKGDSQGCGDNQRIGADPDLEGFGKGMLEIGFWVQCNAMALSFPIFDPVIKKSLWQFHCSEFPKKGWSVITVSRD
jgi:hypothetical protein